MRFLSNYLDFIFESVAKQEMRLYYSDDFRNMLRKIQPKSSIAQALLSSEDSNQMLDIYTLIDITDKNDTISLVQVNRITRGNPDLGETLPYNIRDKKRGSDFWSKARTEMKIGRWTTRVFTEVHKSELPASKIEEFVNLYKSAIDGVDITKFELVNGEDIKKWYLDVNYESRRGQLGNSCMRYNSCQDFFDIYIKNTEVCQLLILKSDDDKDKITGRALIWKLTSDDYYMDRIYTINDSDKLLFQDYARINKIENSYNGNSKSKLEVKLGDHTYEKYPYMDTFVVYNPTTKTLRDDEDLWPGQGYIKVQNTNGGFEAEDAVYSEWHGEYISRDNAIYCENVGDWLDKDEARYLEYKNEWAAPTDDVVWSEYHSEYFFMDDAVYSELMSDILYPDNETVIDIQINDNGDTDWGVKSRTDLYVIELIDEKPRYFLRENYIKDPFTGDYHFKDEKIDTGENTLEYSRYLDKVISEKLGIVLDDTNTDRNGNPTDTVIQKVREDLKNLMKDFEITDEIKSDINVNNIWRNNIRGVFWGLSKENMPTDEDMFLAIKSYPIIYPTSNPYRHIMTLTINTYYKSIVEDFSGSERKFNIFKSQGILKNMMKAAYIFDYSLFPEEIYLRYLFITI
jgi:hypothetical protein